MTLSKTPFYITTLDKISFGIMALGIMTLSTMTVCIIKHAITLDIMTQHNDIRTTSRMSFTAMTQNQEKQHDKKLY